MNLKHLILGCHLHSYSFTYHVDPKASQFGRTKVPHAWCSTTGSADQASKQLRERAGHEYINQTNTHTQNYNNQFNKQANKRTDQPSINQEKQANQKTTKNKQANMHRYKHAEQASKRAAEKRQTDDRSVKEAKKQ